MGIKQCNKKDCKNIMCDTYISDFGYLCDKHFNDFISKKKIKKKLTKFFKK